MLGPQKLYSLFSNSSKSHSRSLTLSLPLLQQIKGAAVRIIQGAFYNSSSPFNCLSIWHLYFILGAVCQIGFQTVLHNCVFQYCLLVLPLCRLRYKGDRACSSHGEMTRLRIWLGQSLSPRLSVLLKCLSWCLHLVLMYFFTLLFQRTM